MSSTKDKPGVLFNDDVPVIDWRSERSRFSVFTDGKKTMSKRVSNMVVEDDTVVRDLDDDWYGNHAPWNTDRKTSYYQSSLWDSPGMGAAKGGVAGSTGGGLRCYHSHKPMPLGDGLFIHGGSCNSPSVKDADVYIGFDYGMQRSDKAYPWTSGDEVFFKITDGSAPGDVKNFKKLVSWAIEQIRNGRKVHAGCIGGHGRTGTFLAAVVAEMTGEKDAINYVRKHYCERAVESDTQVKFLQKHYGIKPAKPSRSWGTETGRFTSGGTKSTAADAKDLRKFSDVPREPREVTPLASNLSIWGRKKS